MKPKFEPTEQGVEIIDPIERHRYHLETGGPVSLESVSTNQIGFPIGSVVQITTDSIELPKTETIFVRDSDGLMLDEVSPTEQATFPFDEYTLDLSGPLKIYARIDSSVQIFSDSEQTYVNFDDKTDVILGARSFHERPAGTITTTAEPTDVMEAVSAFGSALKTTMPERAYPTLRGHPPHLELDTELHIPEKFDRPNSGIRIEIPATLRHVFVVAPLAYYLGATVVPGSEPRLSTDKGYTHTLNTHHGFESSVKQVLQQLFFLDCIVRTEGKTPLPLHERHEVEPILDFDITDVYDRSLAERIERYLEVPHATLEPYLPDWQCETQLEPTADHIEFLPFLANDLAIITTGRDEIEMTPPNRAVEQAIEDFTRDDFVRSAQPDSVRGNKAITTSADTPKDPTIQQSWTGIDDSAIVSTTPLSAYQNNIGRTPKDGPLEIELVCNDAKMREELESVNGTYGTREELPFDITVHYDLSRNDFEEVLARDSDFLHYIGHIDKGGFQCSDGKLDAKTIDTVGHKGFLLNACQSYSQGLHLVESGSDGGIVTLGDIVNSGAISVGSLIARLLNLGFPLYAALDIARQENIVGKQYQMVGDGQATVAQSKTRTPNACLFQGYSESNQIKIVIYTSTDCKRGSVFSPYIDSIESYYVVPAKTKHKQINNSELEKFFDESVFPIISDDGIQWSKDLVGD